MLIFLFNLKIKIKLTKQAFVPRSRLHCSSKVNIVPGKTRGKSWFSCGKLYKQVAVSPLRIIFKKKLLLIRYYFKIKCSYLRKCLNCSTLQDDQRNPLSVCLRSLIIKPSSQGHLVAPGPPK